MSSILSIGARVGRAAAGGGDLGALLGPGAFGGSTIAEAVKLLRAADAEISENGWAQGAIGMLSDGEKCLMGAVYAAGGRS